MVLPVQEGIPPDHLLRSIDRLVELDEVRRELAGFYRSRKVVAFNRTGLNLVVFKGHRRKAAMSNFAFPELD